MSITKSRIALHLSLTKTDDKSISPILNVPEEFPNSQKIRIIIHQAG